MKINYYLAGFLGFLTGVFAIPTVFNLGVKSRIVLLVLPLILPPVFAFGLWFSNLLAKKISFFGQFGRFVAVGFLNTAIDFGVLNILSSLSGVTSGFIIGGVNLPGFTIAVVNSYLWNKLWVFSSKEKENLFHDMPKFLVITIVGLLLNSGIVILATTYLSPVFVESPKAWLNLAKVLATITNLAWNFLGYKFIVFAKK
ncbi:MAG: GtrA family protein [bacterium]|nr:GtrA family protein [bacterium]